MAQSKCPHCQHEAFELVERDDVKDSKFKIMFIQCVACGTVVGTTDFFNVPSLLEKLARKLGVELHD
jgi:uncharacterized Zn finger protein